MTKRNFLIAFRLLLGILAWAGVITQFSITLTKNYGIVDFFSYFTNLSNMFAGTVFIISAIRLMRGVEASRSDVIIRGASVVYMAFVGVVFNTLLRDADLGELMPWVNLVHHTVMPVAVLLDWILMPPKHRISLATAFAWLAFPVAYVAYSLIRGAVVGFYAYPFFNPNVQNGYVGVALYCAAMLVAFLVVSLGVRYLGNRTLKNTGKDPGLVRK